MSRRNQRRKHERKELWKLRGRNDRPSGLVKRTAHLLDYSAPEIEAAGTLRRAVEVGMIDVSREELKLLYDLVPQSRGGRLDHPDADGDWLELVDSAVRARKVDMPRLRETARRVTESNFFTEEEATEHPS